MFALQKFPAIRHFNLWGNLSACVYILGSYIFSFPPTAECKQGDKSQGEKWEGVLRCGRCCPNSQVPED